MRIKKGKLEWIPRVFGWFTAGSNIRNAATTRLAPVTKSKEPNERDPHSANTIPRRLAATADSNQLVRIGCSPRNTDIHLALKPQTNGTRKPQAINTRNRWSNT